MKRFHVHVNVENLESSIRFYNTLFGEEPSVLKSDYAKWMLEDPRINFAISQRSHEVGIDHLGLQADDESELSAIGERLQSADAVALAEKGTTCCYANSDKYWAEDPQGVRWESFYSHGAATTYSSAPTQIGEGSCCGPAMNAKTTKTSCGQNTGCC